MSNNTHPTCDWIGVSGARYTYYVYERHPSISAGQDGNYIYAKLNAEKKWVPVYIGQGDLSVRASGNHHQIGCIDAKGATHVHMHKNGRESDRRAEETDLLANYGNSYTPNGCNVKIGG